MNSDRILTLLLVGMTLIVALQLTILSRIEKPTGVATASELAGDPQRPVALDVPNNMAISLNELHVQGDASARIAIVEFSDYECSYCRRHASDVLPLIHNKYIATGSVRYAVANLPLTIHPSARLLARAAHCAGIQNSLWRMHEALFAEQPRTDEALIAVARRLPLDSQAFEQCLVHDASAEARLAGDEYNARKLGFQGTPSFAIGLVDSNGQAIVKKVLLGAQPIGAFDDVITLVRAGIE